MMIYHFCPQFPEWFLASGNLRRLLPEPKSGKVSLEISSKTEGVWAYKVWASYDGNNSSILKLRITHCPFCPTDLTRSESDHNSILDGPVPLLLFVGQVVKFTIFEMVPVEVGSNVVEELFRISKVGERQSNGFYRLEGLFYYGTDAERPAKIWYDPQRRHKESSLQACGKLVLS